LSGPCNLYPMLRNFALVQQAHFSAQGNFTILGPGIIPSHASMPHQILPPMRSTDKTRRFLNHGAPKASTRAFSTFALLWCMGVFTLPPLNHCFYLVGSADDRLRQLSLTPGFVPVTEDVLHVASIEFAASCSFVWSPVICDFFNLCVARSLDKSKPGNSGYSYKQ